MSSSLPQLEQLLHKWEAGQIHWKHITQQELLRMQDKKCTQKETGQVIEPMCCTRSDKGRTHKKSGNQAWQHQMFKSAAVIMNSDGKEGDVEGTNTPPVDGSKGDVRHRNTLPGVDMDILVGNIDIECQGVNGRSTAEFIASSLSIAVRDYQQAQTANSDHSEVAVAAAMSLLSQIPTAQHSEATAVAMSSLSWMVNMYGEIVRKAWEVLYSHIPDTRYSQVPTTARQWQQQQ
ncbi:hypothetical protein EDC04DRAFT_2613649 [Pisolithus marmoratus]|nr:hypothetical protein EDC04DRAFT_2613649 [Pisolithus marmoratus]